MLVHGAAQPGPHDMGINLRCGNIGMAQHALHAPEVRAAFQQVRGEGVAQDMRCQIAKNTRSLPVTGQ
jgi:hypothetical protein